MPAGRPSGYSQDKASAICSYIAQGNSLRKTCEHLGIDAQTIYNWMFKHPEFLEQYARAKEDSGDADQDRLDEIAEKVLLGEIDPQSARVAADIIKWSASKKKPKKYGDYQRIDQKISKDYDGMDDTELDREIAALEQKLEESRVQH